MGHLLSCGLFGFALEKTDEVLDRHGVDLFAASTARRDFAVGGLAVADDEHVGHFLELRLADLVAELLVAGVELDA